MISDEGGGGIRAWGSGLGLKLRSDNAFEMTVSLGDQRARGRAGAMPAVTTGMALELDKEMIVQFRESVAHSERECLQQIPLMNIAKARETSASPPLPSPPLPPPVGNPAALLVAGWTRRRASRDSSEIAGN